MELRKRPVPVVFNVPVEHEPSPRQLAAETVRTIAAGGSIRLVIEAKPSAQRIKMKNIANRLKRASEREERRRTGRTLKEIHDERRALKKKFREQGLYQLGIKTWEDLQESLMAGDEAHALRLLRIELQTKARRSVAIRIYQRLHLLRGDRERQLIWDQCEKSKFKNREGKGWSKSTAERLRRTPSRNRRLRNVRD